MNTFETLGIEFKNKGVQQSTNELKDFGLQAKVTENSVLALSSTLQSALSAEKFSKVQSLTNSLSQIKERYNAEKKLTDMLIENEQRITANALEVSRERNLKLANDTAFRLQKEERDTKELAARTLKVWQQYYDELFGLKTKYSDGLKLGGNAPITQAVKQDTAKTYNYGTGASTDSPMVKSQKVQDEYYANLKVQEEMAARKHKEVLDKELNDDKSYANSKKVMYAQMFDEIAAKEKAVAAASAQAQVNRNNVASQYKQQTSEAVAALNQRLELEKAIRMNGANSVQALEVITAQKEISIRKNMATQILQIESQLSTGVIASRQLANSLTKGLTNQAEAQINVNRATLEHAQAADKAANAHSHFSKILDKGLSIMIAMAAYRTISFLATVPAGILETNVQMERLKVQLEGIMGNAKDAKIEFERMLSLDVKTPFDIQGLTKTMIMLKDYGLEPTDFVMKSLTDTVAKLGGGTDTLIGISRQFGQAWAKNKLQMMDLRPMIENGLPAISLLSETLHKTAQEVLDMSQKGTITREVMMKMFATMESKAPNAAERNMKTLFGALSNVTTAWTQLQDAMLEDNSETALRGMLENWSTFLFKLTGMISNRIDQNSRLIKSWRDIAEVQAQITKAESAPPSYFSLGPSVQELKNKKKVLEEYQDSIIKAITEEEQAKYNLKNKAESSLANDQEALAFNEKKAELETKAANKKQKESLQELEMQQKLQQAENSYSNSVVESKIKDVDRISKARLAAYDLDLKRNEQNFSSNKINNEERLSNEITILNKIKEETIRSKTEILEYEKQISSQRVVDAEKAWAVIKNIESSNQGGQVNPSSSALGKGQALISTLMDPGVKGVNPFGPAIKENLESMRGNFDKLKEFTVKYEDELEAWQQTYFKGLILKNKGNLTKALQQYGDGSEKYLSKFFDQYDKLTGVKEKELTIANKTKDIEQEKRNQEIKINAEIADAKNKGEQLADQYLKRELDRYNQLTMSAENYLRVKLKTELVPQDKIDEIVTKVKINDDLEKQAKKYDDTSASIKAYANEVDKTSDSVQKFGDISSALFDSKAGGLNEMVGIFERMGKAISDSANEMAILNSRQTELDSFTPDKNSKTFLDDIKNKEKATAKLAKDRKKADSDQLQQELNSTRQMAQAASKMFGEKTSAGKAFHTISKMLAIEEMALEAQKVAVYIAGMIPKLAAGAATMFAQSGWGGFAGVAAMAAVMAGLGVSMMGGGDKQAPIQPESPSTGTVLGDSTKTSDSINNVAGILKDVHFKEYRELKGINKGIENLQTGITSFVTKLFQAGGLNTPSISGLGNSLPGGMAGMGRAFVDGLRTMWTFGMSKVIGDPIGDWILGGLFGKTKTSITGGGIYAGGNKLSKILNGGNISAAQYTEVTSTTKSWFSKSTSIREVLTPISADIKSGLTKIFKGMGESMVSMSNEFGKDMTDKVNSYIIPRLKISLRGLTSDQMIKKLDGILSTQMDRMTTKIFGSLIAQYQKLGEGMWETAGRLLIEKAVVMDALKMTRGSFIGDAIAMADGIATLAKGITNFQTLFQDYYSTFYTEAEQLANTTRKLTESLTDMGMSVPKTRLEYRKLVDAQDLSTQKGREQYVQLLELANAADIYYKSLETLNNSMKLLGEENFKTAVDYQRYVSLANLAGISGASDKMTPNANTTFMPPNSSFGINGLVDNRELIAEIKFLRQEIAKMQASGNDTSYNTKKMADLLQRVTRDGDSLITTPA